MITFFKNLYVTTRFFLAWSTVILCFILGFAWPFLMAMGQALLTLLLALLLVDMYLLFNRSLKIGASREVLPILSLGYTHEIQINIHNQSPLRLHLVVLDELPYQLQERNFWLELRLKARQADTLHYPFRPLSRGVYAFGQLRIFASSVLGLAQRRVSIETAQSVAVYPSIMDMKRHELASVSQRSSSFGLKKSGA